MAAESIATIEFKLVEETYECLGDYVEYTGLYISDTWPRIEVRVHGRDYGNGIGHRTWQQRPAKTWCMG